MSGHPLFKEIGSRVALTQNEFDAVAAHFTYSTINKKHKLVSEGRPNEKAFFIQKGLIFSYRTMESGDIQVVQFGKENHWISDLYSFLTGADALFSVEALEPSELWTLTKKDMDRAIAESHAFETYWRLLFQTAYAHALARISEIYSQDAEVKYDRLRTVSPDLLQRVPQYLIASYLGILPSSLSRIRNKKRKR
jgi:CRP-like cAMP-binding protein